MWLTYETVSRAASWVLCGCGQHQIYCARVGRNALMTDTFFWKAQEHLFDAIFLHIWKEKRHCWECYKRALTTKKQ